MCMLALGNIVTHEYVEESIEEFLERVKDPVVGIHPDGLSFEGFTLDGSTLGWVHFSNEVFKDVKVQEPGCTSIDFSPNFEKFLNAMTGLSDVTLRIGAKEGIQLEQKTEKHVEKKIELPDGWVRGFGELHAALASATLRVPLSKPDIFSIVKAIKKKAPGSLKGRALIFEFEPGKKGRAIIQPFNTVVRLQGPPPDISEEVSIKLYGRRRLEKLEKLIPHAKSFTLHLCGGSRPHFWEMQMGGARFILALSSWTNRKFTKSISESLRGPAALVDDETVQKAARLLSDETVMTYDELSSHLDLSEEQALGVGMALCRQGLAVCEPGQGGIRWRPIQHLPFAELGSLGDGSTREDNARRIINDKNLQVIEVQTHEGQTVAKGKCTGTADTYELEATLSENGTFQNASCSCMWMTKNSQSLKGGPCKHLLALREKVMNKKSRKIEK